VSRLLPEEIDSPRLRLRHPVLVDARTIFAAYAQDAEVCRYLLWAPHTAEAETVAYISACIKAWKLGERLAYVLAERDTNHAIGMLEARMQGTTADLGYVLARAHWGKGLMAEALQAITAPLLQAPGIFRVQAACDIANSGSQRALEKAGFAREGRLERFGIHPNVSPEPRACFMYARVR
jgi:[ribosomal protein S5]-alanine N-acetyltransferase